MSHGMRERGKRWIRIHVTGAQARDLYYPCSELPVAGRPTPSLELIGARRAPADLHVNGRPAGLLDVCRDGDRLMVALAPGVLVLPGENVVSLPVRCDPDAVHIFAAPQPGLGWGSLAAVGPVLSDRHLEASVRFLQASLSRDPFGPGLSSLTAWDQQRGCVRLWSWYWTTGIVYEALALLHDELAPAVELENELAGLESGLLGRQDTSTGPARGSYFVRWDPDRRHAGGIQAWHAPNDAAFLGLHGLLAAHRRTGHEMWLDRAVLLADWIWRRGVVGDRLRVGWNAVTGEWDDTWHYIDAAWTPAFFLALAHRTGIPEYEERAVALARDTIARFATDGPFYLKIWRSNGRHTRTVFARGMAWVLEGWVPLVASGQDWLLPRVRELVIGLLDHQRPDGAWPYLLDRPSTGPCNKGTPAIACHLQRAAPLVPELADRISATVSRALGWCEAQMDLDPASPAHGGIFAHNVEGAISTVRDIPVAFNYASAYYILARRERKS
ncbi:MAG: hypothetical protein IPK64_10935 [bacterium]|nr:hypothetical protein [bacterium]